MIAFLIVSTLTTAPVALAAPRRCGPMLRTDRSEEIKLGRQFAAAFARFTNERLDVVARVEAIRDLTHAYQRAVTQGYYGRSFIAHMKRAKPNVFKYLFDARPKIRWAAVYAIAALQDMSLLLDDKITPHEQSEYAEDRVRPELTRYLHVHQSSLFTDVRVKRIKSLDRGWLVRLNVEVTDEYRGLFRTAAPRVPMPSWVTRRPHLVIHATTISRVVHETAEFTGTNDLDFRVAGQIDIRLNKMVPSGKAMIFVDFALDGQPLQSQFISGDELAALTVAPE